MYTDKIVVVSGPTASGKTAYAINFARENNGVIINADSMQIYKGLPILSAQPSKEELSMAEHLLFSFLEPNDNCNVGRWLNFAKMQIDDCFIRGKTPIIVGGTGMYISKLINGLSRIPEIPVDFRESIVENYDKIGHDEFYKKALEIDADYVKQLNKNDRQRLVRVVEVFLYTGKTLRNFQKDGNLLIYPREKFYHININPPRDLVYQKCLLRFKKMISDDNVISEVKQFIKNNPTIVNDFSSYSISHTIGLIEIKKYLDCEISIDEVVDLSVKITRNYAKRQYTWFNNQFDDFDLTV